MSDIESLVRTSLVIPSLEAEAALGRIGEATERVIMSEGDVIGALSDCLRSGQVIATNAC